VDQFAADLLNKPRPRRGDPGGVHGDCRDATSALIERVGVPAAEVGVHHFPVLT
jgi:hypothetical protein